MQKLHQVHFAVVRPVYLYFDRPLAASGPVRHACGKICLGVEVKMGRLFPGRDKKFKRLYTAEFLFTGRLNLRLVCVCKNSARPRGRYRRAAASSSIPTLAFFPVEWPSILSRRRSSMITFLSSHQFISCLRKYCKKGGEMFKRRVGI